MSTNDNDLLGSILGIEVDRERLVDERIAPEDRAFCEVRQEQLGRVLEQLKWWYAVFKMNMERHRESRNVVFEGDGSVDMSKIIRVYHSSDRADYAAYEFTPFSVLNDVVELYVGAIRSFAGDIIEYFNNKYDVSVPRPELNAAMGFKPAWRDYVNHVLVHLGGRGFRETAIEELIARVHKEYCAKSAELRGDKMVFPDAGWYDNYSWQDKLSLRYEAKTTLDALCAGVIFGTTGVLNGNAKHISLFDTNNIDTSRWYYMGDIAVKFFKNRRVDFRFSNADIAVDCWRKLRLDEVVKKSENR